MKEKTEYLKENLKAGGDWFLRTEEEIYKENKKIADVLFGVYKSHGKEHIDPLDLAEEYYQRAGETPPKFTETQRGRYKESAEGLLGAGKEHADAGMLTLAIEYFERAKAEPEGGFQELYELCTEANLSKAKEFLKEDDKVYWFMGSDHIKKAGRCYNRIDAEPSDEFKEVCKVLYDKGVIGNAEEAKKAFEKEGFHSDAIIPLLQAIAFAEELETELPDRYQELRIKIADGCKKENIGCGREETQRKLRGTESY